MELFVETRFDLNPDPEYDPISCIFYTVFHDAPNAQGLESGTYLTLLIIVSCVSRMKN